MKATSKRLLIGIATGFTALACILLFMLVVTPVAVQAGGAVGGGGSGGGGSGGAQTGHGYGWYQFGVNSGGPGGFRNGNTWSAVSQTCRDAGTDSVIAFIVQTSARTPSSAVVYTYTSAYGTYNRYLGDSGGSWLSYGTAQARFNSIDPAIRAGYVWRSNVAWFCYSNFNYDLTPTISGTPGSTEAAADVTLNQVNVNNTGSTNSATAAWRVTAFRMEAGDNNVPAAGNGPATPTSYYGHGATDIAVKVGAAAPTTTPSQTFSNSPRLTSLASYVPVQQIPDAPVGTRFCYALSVNPRRHDALEWRYSTPFCIIVTKQPKINVIGSDVLVGRGFADTTSQSSIIKTSVTTQKQQTQTVPITPGEITGLWKTGVSDTGDPNTATRLGDNTADPHWVVTRVYRPSGNANTCQYGYPLTSSTPKAIPRTAGSELFRAMTVMEFTDGGTRKVGQYQAPSSYPNILGNEIAPGVAVQIGHGVWTPISTTARWVSLNRFGQNYSATNCHDPTFPVGNVQRDPDSGNIYVFKLKNGFNIPNNIDLNSVKLTIKGAFDNSVRFFVNNTSASSNWVTPGFSRIDSVASTNISSGFVRGLNTLEVHVRSNYSHTGILINEIYAEGTKQVPTSNQYGSWAEYAVSATDKVSGLASAAGFAGGVASTLTTECVKSILTIASSADKNACSASNPTLGNFNTKRTIPDVVSRFPTTTTSPSLSGDVNLGALGSQGVYRGGSSNVINLKESKLGPSQWVVINAPDATVNIDGNQTYANNKDNGNPYTAVSEIPQLVIIAKRINIRSAVEKVDAWLIASKGEGVINTCLDGTAADTTPLSSDICNKLLEVNGPVQAKHLFLRRTFGAGLAAAAGDPAEKFNLRSDAYLWAVTRASTTGRVQTVYTKELPPRF